MLKSRINFAKWTQVLPLIMGLLSITSLAGTTHTLPRNQPLAKMGHSPIAAGTPEAAPAPFQVSVNGVLWRAAWSQWSVQQGGQTQQALGMNDVALVQATGLQLLNTNDANQQPVQWFSDGAAQPLSLNVRFDGQVRYLDIMPLMKQYGWQIETQGSLLKITTPAAAVESLRVGKQTAENKGDRWVLALNRATPWQLVRRKSLMTLSVDAQVPPAVLEMLKKQGAAKGVKLRPKSPRLALDFNTPVSRHPRVWMLPNPNRLIIDWDSDPLNTQNLYWAPGIRWQKETLNLGPQQFPVTWVVINPKQPGLKIQPILPNSDTLVGINPLLKTAQQKQVAVAINGGYFNRNRQTPLGAIRIQNRWISSPILNRGAIAWNEDGAAIFGRLQVLEKLTTSTGKTFTLQSFNSGYVQAGIARYSPAWGKTYTTLTNNEVVITVQGNQVKTVTPVAVAGGQGIPIPQDGYLLTLRSNQTAVSAFPVGATLNSETVTTPSEFAPLPFAIAAGPLLISKNQIVLDAKLEKFSDAFIREQATRSAIARLSNGHLILATAQERLGGDGPTLAEWAQLLQRLGAVDALNLDGGSSTSLYLGGDLVNRASQDVARVHNGIGVLFQPVATPSSLAQPIIGLK